MGALDTPGRGEFDDLLRRVRALETQSPLESSSVKNGRLRFVGGELRVDSGGTVTIVGTLSINGTTNVTGSFTVAGPWTISGNGTITGNVTITGPVSISGTTTISGPTTITGKLVQNGLWELNGNGTIAGTVDVSGRINVGTAMALNPSGNGGQIEFSTGTLSAIGAAIGLYKTGGGSLVLNTAANLIGPGCSFTAGATPTISGLPTINRTTIGSPPIGTVWADVSGNLFRAV